MSTSIIRATPAMLDALTEFSRKVFAEFSTIIAPLEIDAWRETLRALIAGENGCVLVALAGDKVIGWNIAIQTPLYFAPSKKVATSITLWVDPAHRRAGVGARLVDALDSWAHDVGADFMSAGVHARVGELEPASDARASALVSGGFYEGRGYGKSETRYLKEVS